jgi:drug/metabolite transporter (DMT)-like permease
MIWIFPLTLLIIFQLIADVFAKEYSLKGSWQLWLAAIIVYVISNIFWLSAIKNGSGLARGAVIFSVGSAVAAVLIGIYFYHESVTKVEIFGLILGVISMILIFWNS